VVALHCEVARFREYRNRYHDPRLDLSQPDAEGIDRILALEPYPNVYIRTSRPLLAIQAPEIVLGPIK
jgi:hypothetical protein